MEATKFVYILLLFSVAALSAVHATPNAEADPDPDPVLKISQYIVHRLKQSPFQKCTTKAECKKLNQDCIKGYCRCPPGFTEKPDGSCVNVDGLGAKCADNSKCKVANSACVNGTCACKANFVADGNACLQKVAYQGKCLKSSQCPDSNYVCNNAKCECTDAATYIVGVACLPKRTYDQQCQYNEQCSTKSLNSVCSPAKKCTCDTGFQLNRDRNKCVPATLSANLDQELTSTAWNPNLADTKSAEYNKTKDTWTKILVRVPAIISVHDFVFTPSTKHTGMTKFTYVATVHNPDKAVRKRQVTEKEPTNIEDEDGETALVKILKSREVKELTSPIIISAPEVIQSDDSNSIDQFCLQDIDCPTHDMVCTRNTCTI